MTAARSSPAPSIGCPIESISTESGTFQIGPVLAGTVAAGAYMGIVVYFLVAELDAWEEVKATQRAKDDHKEEWDVPPRDILPRFNSGTSVGSLAAAIPYLELFKSPKSRFTSI